MATEQSVILVVGACGLDRLLTVPKYPQPDSKVRTSSFHEIGGGNAANTAAAIGRLTDSTFSKDQQIRVKYLGKVGQDLVGEKLLNELEHSNVDTSSPLCLVGPTGSTTSFTTIIVSEQENTRTCFHTPGSCGELSVDDCLNVDMDIVFENVVHLHSDSRHTSASLYLAKQAKRRGIRVSCDCEKDRYNKDLDELLAIADILFTNCNYLADYLDRSTRQLEEEQNISPHPQQSPYVETTFDVLEETIEKLVHSLTPSAFLARWYPRLGREVVVTHGHSGSLYYQLTGYHSHSRNDDTLINKISISTGELAGIKYHLKHVYSQHQRNENADLFSIQETDHLVCSTGILLGTKVVDTTGAGDAFIGGFLLATLVATSRFPNVSFAMNLASWVAGKKLEGPGVRDSLPTSVDVDELLGKTIYEIDEQLKCLISTFNPVDGK